MTPMGFSTGSLAFGNFRLGLQMVEGQPAAAIELSALREDELIPLIEALDNLDLSQFSYVAVHAPSRLRRLSEEKVVEYLAPVWKRGWSIIVHPDTIVRAELWKPFGALTCIENMDKRKRTGAQPSSWPKCLRSFLKRLCVLIWGTLGRLTRQCAKPS